MLQNIPLAVRNAGFLFNVNVFSCLAGSWRGS